MPRVKANNIELEYDTFGDPLSPPLLMIMGLGIQMIWWDEEFLQMLADRGYYVIRFDNRDVGLSTKFEGVRTRRLSEVTAALMRGEKVNPPYTLEDMAEDGFGLLDALGLEKAHICGASMGGMIAQIMAINRPERVLSLISMMSTTGDPELPPPTVEAGATLMTPPPRERQAYIEFNLQAWKTICSPGLPYDEDYLRRKIARTYDRSFYPEGMARQFLAIFASENRREALSKVTAPALVIHGADDPLLPVGHGRATADAISGAELLIIKGMGHDLPPKAWPVIAAAIARQAQIQPPLVHAVPGLRAERTFMAAGSNSR